MRQLFISIFLLFSIIAAEAQQNFIKGKVFDEKGRPLSGATAIIKNSNDIQTQITDSEGAFLFANLSKKTYTLSVSFLGYETSTQQISVNEDIEIILLVKSYNINEVSVYSLRAKENSAITYTNLRSDEIEERNFGQDIPYLLSLTPSFIATSDAGTGIGYTGFRVRGTDANRINITVNGVPLNDAESHGTFFVNMPDFASSVSSMQIQRGIGSSTNGSAAFGASINMETGLTSSEPYAEFSGTYGSFNTTKYSVKAGSGILNNKLAFDARVSGLNSDGYVDRAFADLKSYYLSAGYYGDNTTLKLLTFGGKERTYLAWYGVDLDLVRLDPLNYKRSYNDLGEYIDDEGNVRYYDNQTDNYTQTHYQLHWNQKISSALNLNVSLHYTDGIGYYEEYKTERDYIEHGLTPAIENNVTREETDLIRQKWLDNDFYGFTFALNYENNRIDASLGGSANRYDGNHFGKILWARNPADDFNPENDWYRNKGIKDDANIYAKTTIETIKNLFISADLQLRYIKYKIEGEDDKYDSDKSKMRDITQTHTYPFFNPKIGVSYKMNNRKDVYASFSIANREPNRNNYTDASENERPTSERLYDSEIGYRYHSPRASFAVNLYHMQYKDQLILTGKVSEIGEALTTNIKDSYRQGIELQGGVKISEQLRWDGNLTLTRNKISNFSEFVDVYDANWNWLESREIKLGSTDIAYSPNLNFNSIVKFNYKSFESLLQSNYVGKQYIDNTSSDDRAINPYFVNNLILKYHFPVKKLQGLSLQLAINNLFDVEYESNGYNWYTYILDNQRYNEKRYFPQAGTNFLLATTIRF